MRRRRGVCGGAACVLALLAACSRDRPAGETSVASSGSPSAPRLAPPSAPSAGPSSPSVVPAIDAAAIPDLDALPWEDVGAGVARKDTRNPAGDGVLVAWAGWKVSLASAEAWATALQRASLARRGIRWLFAVRGPAHPYYVDHEIGTDALAAALVATMSARTKTVVAIAHSSGALVAHELFERLAHGADPTDSTKDRIAYFELDGEEGGLDAELVGRLRRAYFVGAFDATIATASHEDFKMRAAGARWAAAGGYFRVSADGSGCAPGAGWCLHMTLVTTKPHDRSAAKEIDFSDFVGREVSHAYLDEKAEEAGL